MYKRQAGRGPTPEQARLLMQGLFTTITNVNFDPAAVDALTRLSLIHISAWQDP